MRMHRTIGIVVFLAVVFCVAIGMQAEPLPGISRAQPPPPPGPFWRLLGNAGTNPPTHFLGTRDTQPLVLKTNGVAAMRIDIAGNVGIGTSTPAAKLHIDEGVSTTNQEVVRITFSNDAPSLGVRGLRAVSTPLNAKGTQIGVQTQTSKTGGPDAQRGSAQGLLSHSSGFFLRGTFVGVQGTSRPNVLDNFNNTATSHGLGGFFRAEPDNTLTLDNTGTYWIGGAYGEVAGTIDNTPNLGAVAGIIGVDNAAGTADSYAGYFDGRLRVTDLPQNDNLSDVVVADSQGVLHTRDASTLGGADNDWLFAGNNIYRTSDTVAIGSFPGGAALLSALYVKNIAGDNAAQRIEHSGTNVMGLFINPISGGDGPSLWANGRGRFDALVVGSVAGDNVAFNPGSGNLIVAKYLQLAVTSVPPPPADCLLVSHLGRMIVDDSGGGVLWVCTKVGQQIQWVAK